MHTSSSVSPVDFFFIFFQLKDNCFTILCWFLPYINMNQPQVYIRPLPLEPPSYLPPLWLLAIVYICLPITQNGIETFLSPQKELLLPKSVLPLFRQPLCNFRHHQFSSVAQLCLTLCDPMDCSTPGFPVHHNSRSLLRLMSIESVMPSNHLILCLPLLHPPSIFPSIRVFSNESVLCIRWPKYWSFSFNISPSNEYSGLLSFRTDWLDLLAVQWV